MPPKLVPRALLAATAATAVAGLYGGLLRFGAALPFLETPVDLHGLLMMHGFFGTLVPLERAVALGQPVWFAAPALSAAGSAMLLLGQPAGMLLLLFSAAIFVAMSMWVLWLQAAVFNLALLFGAGALLAGTAVMAVLGSPVLATPLWLAFLVLTVSAERLELSRMVGTGRTSAAAFLLVAGFVLIGACPAVRALDSGLTLASALLSMAAWLALNDVARHRLAAGGQTAFMATAIICGHVWLSVAGLAMAAEPTLPQMRDVSIHAIGIGFAMSMIMGHVLIILPAVGGWRPVYRHAMYLPLCLLQLSVAVRAAFDLLAPDLRWTTGPATILAILSFGIIAAIPSSTAKAQRQIRT